MSFATNHTSATAAVRVDVWSDFVCPFCYIGALRLAQLDRQRPLDIHWHAFQLRPAGAPPMDDAKRRMIAEHTPKTHSRARCASSRRRVSQSAAAPESRQPTSVAM